MKRFVTLIALPVLAVAMAAPAQDGDSREKKDIEEKQDKPKGQTALRVAVNQVRVDVTVRTKRGDLIQGLQKKTFKIYEDKVEQEIVNFTSIEAPMTVVMVTEYSNVLPWQVLYEAWMASHMFVEQMKPEDWFAVIAYDLRPEILVDFTQNKFEAFDSLRRLSFPGFSESCLYDTIIDVLDRLEEVDDRTAVVLISTGLDTLSKKNMDEALNRVKKTHVVIYALGLGQLFRTMYDVRMTTSRRHDFYRADAVLKAFAKSTGGDTFFPRYVGDYPAVFQTISNMLRHQYSLSYIPSNTKKAGKFRKIKVEVEADLDGNGKMDKLKVNHRQGYLAEKS